ncbi:MAG: hypothetical protein ACRCZY_09220 [Phocaeicola sp.]
MDNAVFYHGSDARIINMAEEERDSFKKICFSVCEVLRPYFPLSTSHLGLFREPLHYEENTILYSNLLNALSLYDGLQNDSKFFQYDDFYVTNNRSRAESYANSSFAFGEVGLMAYRMVEVAREMGIEKVIHPATYALLNKVIDFAESEAQPIVVTFDDLDISLLKFENGNPIDFDYKVLSDTICSFRYKGNVIINESQVEHLKKSE